jgi:hypothetical protein
MKKLLLLSVCLLIICLPAFAQTQPEPPYNNIVAAGPNYGQSASPQITGSVLYGKLLAGGTSPTYSFTLIDLSPIKVPALDSKGKAITKFSFQTATTTGLAQYLRSIGPAKIYIVGTIGGAAGGNNAGLAWSSGGAVVFRIGKKGFLGMLNLRVLKTNTGPNASDYQGIVGLMLGFGSK